MSDPDHKARLEALEKRIAAAKGPEKPPRAESHESQASLGWRMVIELVTGLLVGFGMGYGLDRLLGTLPIFLVIFTLLGFAAGVRVMMKSAAEFSKSQSPQGNEGTQDGG